MPRCGYNRPCAHQYVGKSQSCMVQNGRFIPQVIVVFKGFVEGVDSFGSLKYSREYFREKNLSFVAKEQQAGVRQCTISIY